MGNHGSSRQYEPDGGSLRGSPTAAQGFQHVTEQFTEVLTQAEELARFSAEAIQAITQVGTVLARGAQQVSRELLAFAADRLQKNVEALDRIATVGSLPDFVAAQSDLARDILQHITETNRHIAELTLRVADEAGCIMLARVDKSANQIRRAA
jgi:phasin family protein